MSARTFDLRNQPAYSISEAARYLKLPAATLRSWMLGRPYPKAGETARFKPLFQVARKAPPALSFYNLIEAHVLRSLRTEHGVPIREVRNAIDYAEKSLQIDRLLLHKDLLTHAGNVFLEKYGNLINLSASGQLALRKYFEEHLKRVEWDDRQFPIRLYPFTAIETSGRRPIAIDPSVAFGRPVLLRAGVTTRTIAERLDAGETVSDLTNDYDITAPEVEEAVMYERAA